MECGLDMFSNLRPLDNRTKVEWENKTNDNKEKQPPGCKHGSNGGATKWMGSRNVIPKQIGESTIICAKWKPQRGINEMAKRRQPSPEGDKC